MDKEKVKLLEASFVEIDAHKGDLAACFYKHLFELAPETQAMFHKGNYVRKEMMIGMLATTIRLLSRPEAFHKMSTRLAKIHENVGVTQAQYLIGLDAMMLALRDILQDQFTPGIEAAWREAMQKVLTCLVHAE